MVQWGRALMQRPRLSFWRIWNMSFGFFGIQFGWGLQMSNMSAIYRFLGANESQLPVLWLAAPLTGLLVQPVIGYASDRTWCRLGRRRPYFLTGALLASLALLLMPGAGAVWMAAGLLWVLDASINITMEPFRAFVGDLLPESQRKSGFAMQSVLIGLGAVLSSALPYLLINGFGVSQESTLGSPIPPAVRLAFNIGSGVLLAGVLYTILSTAEYPPEDAAAFQRMKQESAGLGAALAEITRGIFSMPKPMRRLAIVQFFTWLALFCMWIYFVPAVATRVFHGAPLAVADPTALRALHEPKNQQYLAEAAAVARAYEARKQELEKASGPVVRSWHDAALRMFGLRSAPPDAGERIDQAALRDLMISQVGAAKQLEPGQTDSAMVQVFAAALLQHQVTPERLGGAFAAAAQLQQELEAARRYVAGTAWGGVCFSAYNGTAFVFAFGLLALVKRLAARTIHGICLLCGGTGLLLTLVMAQPHLLLVSMVLVGIAWASILAMPYAMLSTAIPPLKMGFYMGVFNFFIVIPQILASLGLGTLMKQVLGNEPMNAVVLGGVSMVIAGLAVGLVPKEVEGGPDVPVAQPAPESPKPLISANKR
jgi:maltose/moltooligosaccharide transporter